MAPTYSTDHQHSSSAAERSRADFHPSVWGDYFLPYASKETMDSDHKAEKQIIKELKAEVKRILVVAATKDDPLELLNLIDHIQRLGLGYHFEEDIDEALQRIHERSWCNFVDETASHTKHNLQTTSLMFRLLRQHGYRIPSSNFGKFRGPDGNFDESLKSDVRALLSLYEASHLRVHGEDILEEAYTFTVSQLTSMKEQLSPPLRDEICHALKHPIRRALRRLEAWYSIRFYEQDASHIEVLLRLAKLDFNLIQMIQKKELGDITRWWKTLDVEKNFPYARDRIAEGYFWSQVAYEPDWTAFRTIFTKTCGLISILDDTFDAHGTYEELELFTNAVERWDMEVIDKLPDYMQILYKALLDAYKEFEQMMPEEVRSFRSYYGIESMKIAVRAYFDEAKWYHQKYNPTYEEYMEVALVSSGALLLITSAFLGMGEVATRDAFEWLFSRPKILKASEAVYRLVNDTITHKFERKRGHLDSAVECYMEQHGVSEEEAKHELCKRIDDAWKDINEDLLHPMAVPAPLLNMILNVTRMIDVFYEDGHDFYTNSNTKMKDVITSILVNPFPVTM